MNKAAIQRFAMKARTDLIDQVSQRAYQYGITKDSPGDANAVTVGGRALNTEEQRQRRELVEQIQRKGYTQVMEEVAYTWFNRFIALRFMEVNNYLPSHIRVFSDASGAFKPEILNDVLHLDLPGLDTEKVAAYIESNQTEDLYRYLLLTQCNALNDALPQMFEKMGGYTELLLPNNILKQDSVLGHMVTDIEENDWTDQVQIIGWLYQYYNSELKDDTFALLKKNVKITKERIPSATQLFTPDWIVRYMVENSLGRLWLEHLQAQRDSGTLFIPTYGVPVHQEPDGSLVIESGGTGGIDGIYKDKWKYYLDDAKQEPEVEEQLKKCRVSYADLNPEDIKVIDPCMGSGHILVYAFDVLMQIYTSCGYTERDAAGKILQNNLYGLDIDDRAAQLAYFAVMMKARQYDRRIFSRGIQPNIHSIVESNGIDRNHLKPMGDNIKDKDAWQKDYDDICYILDFFMDAKEYGSILNPEHQVDFKRLYEFRGNYAVNQLDFETVGIDQTADALFVLIKQYAIMAQKYDVVVTNPPYMGASNGSTKLNDYIKKNFPDSKADLFACFIERCQRMTKSTAYTAMITQHSWMFLSSFEKLRTKLLLTDTVNMAHLGARAFEEIGGEVVQTTAWVQRKSHVADYQGTYARLVDYNSQQEKEHAFLARQDLHTAQQENFSKIPGSPIAYWVSEKFISTFNSIISDVSEIKQGLATCNNNRFLRSWYEVCCNNIGFNFKSNEDTLGAAEKWFPYNKGGGYRKWYGNNFDVVNWKHGGRDIHEYNKLPLDFQSAPVRAKRFYFKSGITYGLITSSTFSARNINGGYVFDVGGSMLFPPDDSKLYILGLLCTKLTQLYLDIINPTLNYQVGDIGKVPIIISSQYKTNVENLTEQNISISKSDWDSYETSWDFKRHPLV